MRPQILELNELVKKNALLLRDGGVEVVAAGLCEAEISLDAEQLRLELPRPTRPPPRRFGDRLRRTILADDRLCDVLRPRADVPPLAGRARDAARGRAGRRGAAAARVRRGASPAHLPPRRPPQRLAVLHLQEVAQIAKRLDVGTVARRQRFDLLLLGKERRRVELLRLCRTAAAASRCRRRARRCRLALHIDKRCALRTQCSLRHRRRQRRRRRHRRRTEVDRDASVAAHSYAGRDGGRRARLLLRGVEPSAVVTPHAPLV